MNFKIEIMGDMGGNFVTLFVAGKDNKYIEFMCVETEYEKLVPKAKEIFDLLNNLSKKFQ